ncbi:hypothetical protein [Streptomyces sp. WMMC897]|uniref:hypothetical protein n=1 Tax=Streptomyces sp. WMMC897 TaxID=3014782 RepID=UPI0022B67B50|nr:hypothetical protein [Streptomyces sp. WMMC897]MCZ7414328.1 hypothetical protein [Streptomyces sp. WMMC897]
MSPAAICHRCQKPGDLAKVYDNPGESRSGGSVWWCASCREPLRLAEWRQPPELTAWLERRRQR